MRVAVIILIGGVLTATASCHHRTESAHDDSETPLTEVIDPIGTPISELPESIDAPDGKVTLTASFERLETGSVPVYLINRTDEDVVLDAQDGDVYLKLEMRNDDGTWVRAQPHVFSWCGNSYMVRPKLKRDHFYKIEGYQPADGNKAIVRYRLFMQKGLDLVTLPGNGIVHQSDVHRASTDEMTIRTATLNFVRSVALRTPIIETEGGSIKDPQICAILELASGRFTAEHVSPILDQVEREFPRCRNQVLYARSRLNADQN